MPKEATLMIIKHNDTGMKYLCVSGRTGLDLVVYLGSGPVWKQHLADNGINVSKEILGVYDCKTEFKLACQYYSEKFDVANNPEFANEIAEGGQSVSLRLPEKRPMPCKYRVDYREMYGKRGQLAFQAFNTFASRMNIKASPPFTVVCKGDEAWIPNLVEEVFSFHSKLKKTNFYKVHSFNAKEKTYNFDPKDLITPELIDLVEVANTAREATQ